LAKFKTFKVLKTDFEIQYFQYRVETLSPERTRGTNVRDWATELIDLYINRSRGEIFPRP